MIDQLKNLLDKITDESSRIDVLVNNAGYGVMGAIEDLSLAEFKSQFETNLLELLELQKKLYQ